LLFKHFLQLQKLRIKVLFGLFGFSLGKPEVCCIKLILSRLLVDLDSSASDDVHAVFGLKRKALGFIRKHNAPQGAFSVSERIINMSGLVMLNEV
jgi:hypothetical protein